MDIFRTLDIALRRYVLGNDHRITTGQPAPYIKRDMRGMAKEQFIKSVEEICDTKNYPVTLMTPDEHQKVTHMRVTQLPPDAIYEGRITTRKGQQFLFKLGSNF